MKEKIIDYGTTYNVEVFQSSKSVLAVKGNDPLEAYVMIHHGIDPIPAVGELGYIVFEKDANRGHWQYYKKENLDFYAHRNNEKKLNQ